MTLLDSALIEMSLAFFNLLFVYDLWYSRVLQVVLGNLFLRCTLTIVKNNIENCINMFKYYFIIGKRCYF